MKCDLVTVGVPVCIEYKQPNAAAAANQTSTCKSNGATVVDQCSTAGLVGTCAYTDSSGIPEVVHTYAGDAGVTTSSAKQVCDSEQGTFTPP